MDFLDLKVKVKDSKVIRRNCTEIQDFQEAAKHLTQWIRARGYPKNSISKAHDFAKKSEWENLLQPKPRGKDVNIKIVIQFNNQWGEVYRLFKSNWHLLFQDSRISNYITDKPQIVARRVPYLKDKLVESHFRRQKSGDPRKRIVGTYAYGHCNICQWMIGKEVFGYPQNGKVFKLRNFINCRTRNVVYALICPCNKIYVGQTTQEIRKRVQRHFSYTWQNVMRHR